MCDIVSGPTPEKWSDSLSLGGQAFLIGSWVNGLASIRQTLLDEINL